MSLSLQIYCPGVLVPLAHNVIRTHNLFSHHSFEKVRRKRNSFNSFVCAEEKSICICRNDESKEPEKVDRRLVDVVLCSSHSRFSSVGGSVGRSVGRFTVKTSGTHSILICHDIRLHCNRVPLLFFFIYWLEVFAFSFPLYVVPWADGEHEWYFSLRTNQDKIVDSYGTAAHNNPIQQVIRFWLCEYFMFRCNSVNMMKLTPADTHRYSLFEMSLNLINGEVEHIKSMTDMTKWPLALHFAG